MNEKKALYAGFDSSQYSNGEFKEKDNKKEICSGIFSLIHEDTDYITVSNKRETDYLSSLNSNYRKSLSVRVDPRNINSDSYISPLSYGSVSLTKFFIKNTPFYNFDSLEMHFDGPVSRKEKNFIKENLLEYFPEVKIRSYIKYFNQVRLPAKRRNNPKAYSKYCKIPFLVNLADIISNQLFKTYRHIILLDICPQTTIKLPLGINGNAFNHHHIFI
ncbi:MAG: hypothetical protein ACP5OG_01890 [Candidatus Nanoarchaeia archaeon]